MLMRDLKRFLLFLLLLLTMLIVACGGDGSESGSGDVLIGLTDAEGDFQRYQVSVESLTLTRADGLVVETLPVDPTPVDFNSLVEVTEFLTAATVPNGRYTSLTLSLDYTNADIVVEKDGAAVSAVAVDDSGEELTSLAMTVELANNRPLVVSPGIPALLTLDFDLLATNSVDTLSDPPLVTVEPLLIAEVNPEKPKPHRLRGPLLSVNEEQQQFTLAVRAHRQLRHDFGKIPVQSRDETVYEINGEMAKGAEGLAILAAQEAGTAVIVFGEMHPLLRQFSALEVYAGSSVPGGTLDAITGTVIAREGDLLTVKGALLDRGDHNHLLRQAVYVQLDDTTHVARQLSPGESFTIEDISVGQRLTALGEFSDLNNTLVADGARMLLTGLTGLVEANDSEFAVALHRLGRLAPAAFDFTGTGVTPEEDADPAFYQLSVEPFDLSDLSAGDPIHARGFVTPFGASPPDFTVMTLANASGLTDKLKIRWSSGTTTGVTVTGGATALSLDLIDASRHFVITAGIPLELDPEVPVEVLPHPDGGIFVICSGGLIRVYNDFATFAEALSLLLEQETPVVAVTAGGDYSASNSTFTTNRLGIAFAHHWWVSDQESLE